MRPRIFLASATPDLEIAETIQENLERDFTTTVWNQGVFTPSTYPLESLENALAQNAFGVFIMAPHDVINSGKRKKVVVRDNVLFELGMFFGRHGRHRSFLISPNTFKKTDLASDLHGLTLCLYDADRFAKEPVPAVSVACTQVRRAIRKMESSLAADPGALRNDVFPQFNDTFAELLKSAQSLTTCFIHSRRWRENHNDAIKSFLSRSGTSLTAFLPNLTDRELMRQFVRHFEDGPFIAGFVKDAYVYFAKLSAAYPGQLQLRSYRLYPTYSFYKFDDKAVIAHYPLSTIKKDVPTTLISMSGTFGSFLAADLTWLEKHAHKLSKKEIQDLVPKRK